MTGRKKVFWTVFSLLLLTGGIVTCAVRWQVWFGNPPEPAIEGDTIRYRFRTYATEPVAADSLTRILLLGDVHNGLTHSDYLRMADEAGALTAYAQLGDFVDRGYPYYFQELFRELQGTPFDSLPIINCPGNHEYMKGIRRTLPELWYRTFPQPQNGPRDFLGSTYYVDFQQLRFIVIDTNGLQWIHDYTRTLTWLNAVMAEAQSANRFVVAMMHHPVYSCAAGRFNVLIYGTFCHALKRADLVFAGHDHNYARRLPFVNTNTTTRYKINKVNARDTRIASCCRFYELLTVVSDTLCMQTYLLADSTGSEVYDEVRIVKHADGSRQVTDLYGNANEIIGLPARYEGRNDLKVRRFYNRREARRMAQVLAD